MTFSTTLTGTTASATGSGRRKFAPRVCSEPTNSRGRDTWPESSTQVVEVGQIDREGRIADLRRTLKAPAWAAAVTALQQEGGEA